MNPENQFRIVNFWENRALNELCAHGQTFNARNKGESPPMRN
jgi:hypothetical protein